jgi:SagB-type dehydrogenase family enzyme
MEIAGGKDMNLVKFSAALILIMLLLITPAACEKAGASSAPENVTISLPAPSGDSDTSIEEALLQRRSVRNYREGALTLAQVGQILWAAQGINDAGGKRTAPSAGAIYPLTVYVVIGSVEGITPGVYRYIPASHSLDKKLDGDLREALSKTSQSTVKNAPVNVVIAAVYDQIKKQYGDRGIKFTYLEAGHAAQNICLQVVALKLGTVTLGYFDDTQVKKTLGLSDNEEPLYIMPVGRTAN